MKKIISIIAIMYLQTAVAQLREVTYADGKQKLNGIAVHSGMENSAKPGILLLPAWKGIGLHEKEVASELSELGYYVFIADIYGEGNYPKSKDEAGKQSGYYKKNYTEYQKRISLALEQLVKSGADAGNIAIIGYCFGGGGALEAARAGLQIKGVVSFHGTLAKDKSRTNEVIKTKVLVLHGADDPSAPKADVDTLQQEMKESKADWQLILYANTVHSFTHKDAGNDNSKGSAYNELADKRSWKHLLSFLEEILQK